MSFTFGLYSTESLEQSLTGVLESPLSKRDVCAISKLESTLYSSAKEERDCRAERILSQSFPVDRNPLRIYVGALDQVAHWLRGLLPRSDNIVMLTNMTGAHIIAYRSKQNKKLFCRGAVGSARANWLKCRFEDVWPAIVPNDGKPFLFIARKHCHYVLEP